MKNLLQIELQKSMKNWMFFMSLAVGSALVVFTFFQAVNRFYSSDLSILKQIEFLENNHITTDIYIGSQSMYNNWLGGNRYALGASLFFALTPILAALPCGWSFCEERHNGYLRVIIPRSGRMAYFFSKMVSSFIAGGLTILLPQLFSVLLTALMIPAVGPDPLYAAYFGITQGSMLSVMFYSHPLAAIGITLVFDFIFGGLFAWISMAVAFYTSSRAATIIIPFLILTFAGMCQSLFSYTISFSIAPLDMLHPFSSNNIVTWPGILTWMAIISIVTAGIIIKRGYNCEIS